MMWAPKDAPPSMVIKLLQPRVNMIFGLDNDGVVYGCLTQQNTNDAIMGLYIKELVKLLDKEDPLWRGYTVILHDGAKYCQSKSVLDVLKQLRVPFMLSSPHSYNISPIEMLFGAIKTGNLNPSDLPVGKR